MNSLRNFLFDFESIEFGNSALIHADCFKWLSHVQENSIDAIVTDPPYGVKEYEIEEIERMNSGGAGIWRLPPAYDGHVRSPLPRFTALNKLEREQLYEFFLMWGQLALKALKPGGHIFIASNAFMSQSVFSALIEAGLEFRTEIIRLVQTLRGGDRPKLGEKEFPNVCSLPRGCYEPWGLFRKPIPKGTTVRECLERFGTGGVRRLPNGNPFFDVISSERTPKRERIIAEHPSLKPQSLMRQLVYASLPLGKGTVLDPFMGSGSTVAAAEAIGYSCIGIERHDEYYRMAIKAVPELKKQKMKFNLTPESGVIPINEQISIAV